MNKSDFKKPLAVAVIFLFIGLAVAPSINANMSKEALVEFTTEACGLNGRKQTVKLTQEEAEEVEALFDSIVERLNASESSEEAEEIFKEAVVELDKYGLLGGLSVEQAQQIVLRNFPVDNNKRILNRKSNVFTNALCMFVGIAIEGQPMHMDAVLASFGLLQILFLGLVILGDEAGLEFFTSIFSRLFWISDYFPLKFMNVIISLFCYWIVVSIGLNGLVTIGGDDEEPFLFLGFTGLLLHSVNVFSSEDKYFFLGFCLGFF